MTVCCPARTADSNLKRIISTNCCIHTVVPPDDGPRYARNMYRLMKCTKNTLWIKLGFLYTIISRYSMAVFFPLILFFTAVLSKPNKSDPLILLTGWVTTQVNWLKEQFKSFFYPGLCTGKIPSNKSLIKKKYIEIHGQKDIKFAAGTW